MNPINDSEKPPAESRNIGIHWRERVPEDWDVLPLRRVTCRVSTGRTPPLTNADYFTDGELNWFTPGDFSTGIELHESARKVTSQAVEDGVCTLFSKGTVFLVGIGATLGKVAVSTITGSANQQLNAILPDKHTDPYFMAYCLEGFRTEVRVTSNGNTLGILNQDGTKSLVMPVPPLDTQQRIAQFLDEKTAQIDGLIEKKRALLERLAEKRQALITRAVTKGLNPDAPMKPSGIDWLGDIPEHWDLVSLKRLGRARSGITKGKSYSTEDTVVLPYLRVANVQDGWLDLDEIAEIEVREIDVDKYSLKYGDILMNEGGDNDKLGRGAVWESQIFPCLHQNHVFAVRVVSVEPNWIARCTEAAYAKFHFFRRAVQSTNLASISRNVVADLPIPLPPELEVQEILGALDSEFRLISEQTDMVDRTIRLLDEYRAALITAAVTGQISGLQ